MSPPALTPVIAADRAGGGDPLLARFGEFYAELLRIKAALSVGGRRVGRAKDLGIDEVSATVHRHLRVLLERQAAQARKWGGSYGQALYAEAEYVMAALADETLLLRIEWAGRDAWQSRLLETALFDTSLAGERVFERLDALLADPGRAHPGLAAVYLIALALGFRGRYWRPGDEGQLRVYRTALARIITRAIPEAGEVGPRLFSQPYRYTVDDGRPVRLPGLRPWYAAVAAVTLAFLVGGHVLWHSAVVELEQVIAEIDMPRHH
ncbi:MAG: DotU family type IV/VI secretion system protein [Rhodospirillaceae bacterium]